MFTKTKIALAAALVLGTASAALANDSGENHQDNDRSTVVGVNHMTWGNSASAAGAYGYAAPSIHKHRPVHDQTQSR
jgi:alpha-galactosidase/6-phospho-beta-glucosidase family protein